VWTKLQVEQGGGALIGWRRAAEEQGRTGERNSRARFGYMEGTFKKIEIKKPKGYGLNNDYFHSSFDCCRLPANDGVGSAIRSYIGACN
jgi:hypothetical protein